LDGDLKNMRENREKGNASGCGGGRGHVRILVLPRVGESWLQGDTWVKAQRRMIRDTPRYERFGIAVKGKEKKKSEAGALVCA